VASGTKFPVAVVYPDGHFAGEKEAPRSWGTYKTSHAEVGKHELVKPWMSVYEVEVVPLLTEVSLARVSLLPSPREYVGPRQYDGGVKIVVNGATTGSAQLCAHPAIVCDLESKM
jgi:hypothetical protein